MIINLDIKFQLDKITLILLLYSYLYTSFRQSSKKIWKQNKKLKTSYFRSKKFGYKDRIKL